MSSIISREDKLLRESLSALEISSGDFNGLFQALKAAHLNASSSEKETDSLMGQLIDKSHCDGQTLNETLPF